MIGTNETNCFHNLLFTDRQVSMICKTFAKNLSMNVNLPKSHISKMIHSNRFLGRLISPVMKIGLPLMRNLLLSLA